MTIDECVGNVLDPNAEPWITLACDPGFIQALKERLRTEQILLDCIDDQAPVTTWLELLDRLDERFKFGAVGDYNLNAWKDYMVEDEYWLEDTPILQNGYVICFTRASAFRGKDPELKEYLSSVSDFGWFHRQLLIKFICCG